MTHTCPRLSAARVPPSSTVPLVGERERERERERARQRAKDNVKWSQVKVKCRWSQVTGHVCARSQGSLGEVQRCRRWRVPFSLGAVAKKKVGLAIPYFIFGVSSFRRYDIRISRTHCTALLYYVIQAPARHRSGAHRRPFPQKAALLPAADPFPYPIAYSSL